MARAYPNVAKKSPASVLASSSLSIRDICSIPLHTFRTLLSVWDVIAFWPVCLTLPCLPKLWGFNQRTLWVVMYCGEKSPVDHCNHHLFQDYNLLIVGLWWIVEHNTIINSIPLLRVVTEQAAFGRQALQQWTPAAEEGEEHQALWVTTGTAAKEFSCQKRGENAFQKMPWDSLADRSSNWKCLSDSCVYVVEGRHGDMFNQLTKPWNCKMLWQWCKLKRKTLVGFCFNSAEDLTLQIAGKIGQRTHQGRSSLSFLRKLKRTSITFQALSLRPNLHKPFFVPTSPQICWCCQVGKIIQADNINDWTHHSGIILKERERERERRKKKSGFSWMSGKAVRDQKTQNCICKSLASPVQFW